MALTPSEFYEEPEIKMGIINKKLQQSFVAGTDYDIALTDFGIPSGTIIRGLAMAIIGGNTKIDYEGSIVYRGAMQDKFTYHCMANNTTQCTFQGVYFSSAPITN